jgi:hypothetical protein
MTFLVVRFAATERRAKSEFVLCGSAVTLPRFQMSFDLVRHGSM